MDVSGAYDNVVKDRLVHILRQKGVPASIVGWVRSFMTQRTTTLIFDGRESGPLQVAAGIPQGSPISPILYLFYNAELINICNPQNMRVHGIGFVDDVNLIAWGSTTRGNCDNLTQLHERCLGWARRHGAKFEPSKYELMHFTRSPKKFNTKQELELGEVKIKPTEAVRVLGLHLDPKLQWKKHKAETLNKMATHTNALTRLAGSTWGLPMLQARQVYTMVIRPAMAYAALAWHQPASSRGQGLAMTRAFQKVQNKCLRSVTGGFKATPIRSLETLAHVPPLDLYLTSRVIAYRARARNSGVDRLIEKACTRIKSTLGKPQVCTTTADVGHPRPVRRGWAEEWVGPRCGQDPPKKTKRDIGRALRARWKDRWEAAPRSAAEAVPQPPSEKVLSLHQGLHKAESSLLVQLRTGKIGLRDFLHNIGVPEVTSAACTCGHERETPKHVTIFCPLYQDTRDQLRVNGRLDFEALLTTVEGVKRVTRWWLRRRILGQFWLAEELIA
jgi:hypothetical protein